MSSLTLARKLLDTRDRITSLEARTLGEELAEAVIMEAHSVSVNEPKGKWVFERSSGYAGFRCQKCAAWIYENNTRECICDLNGKEQS